MPRRPGVFLVTAFILGIWLALQEIDFIFIPIAVLFLGVFAFFYNRGALKPLLFAFIVLLAGFFFAKGMELRVGTLSDNLDLKSFRAEFKATDFSDEKSVVAITENEGKKIKVYLTCEDIPRLLPGDTFETYVTLNDCRQSKKEYANYLYSQGLFIRASAKNIEKTGTDFSGISGKFYKIRRAFRKSAEGAFRGDTLGLYQAMVIGDSSLLSPEVINKLRGAGISHIAVVSGMHLSIMISIISMLLNFLLGKRRITAFLCVLAAIFITLMCGGGASVVRACIMCVLFEAARIIYRENDPLNSLFIAAFVMAVVNPYIIYNTGFVLSFLATFGIIVFSKRILGILKKFMPNFLAGILSLSICAQLTVVPYIMYAFLSFTPYSLFSNVLIAVVADIFVSLGMFYPLISKIPLICSLFRLLINGASFVILAVSEAVNKIPGANLTIKGTDAFFICLWIFMLCALSFYPQKKNLLIRIGALLLAVCIFCVGINYFSKGVRIEIIDDSEKMSSVILKDDCAVLIGCANYYEGIEIADRKAGGYIESLIINNQYSTDVLKLMESGKVKNVILCEDAVGKGQMRIENLAKEKGINTVFIKMDEKHILPCGAILKYLSFNKKYVGEGAVCIEYKDKSFVSLEGMKLEKAKEFSKEIYADIVALPLTIKGQEEMVFPDINAKILKRDENFLLKDK